MTRSLLQCLLFTDYAESGFLTLQLAIDSSIIQHQLLPDANTSAGGDSGGGAGAGELPLNLWRYSYPPYLLDTFLPILYEYFAYFVMLTFLFTAPCIVKDVVLEKQRKLKVDNS